MDQVPFYLSWGFDHIISMDGMDHILFIAALALPFGVKEWRRILLLVTAFTIGHGITLFLSVFDVLQYNRTLIEFLIPITILITALSNFMRQPGQSGIWVQYGFALFFGLIHGLAYSSNISMSLASGQQSILLPLFAFNIGLEAGQIIIVGITVALGFTLTQIASLSRTLWLRIGSAIIAVLAIYLITQAELLNQL